MRIHDSADSISSDVLDDFASRIGRSPLYLLSLEKDGPRVAHVRGPRVDNLETEVLIGALRQADVESLLRRPGANLPACDVIHYCGPGGNHYRAFSRPGFALHTTDDFDSISFWLYEYLRNTAKVVVDHWSMVALAYSALAYVRPAQVDSSVAVESVTSYDESDYDLTSRFRRAFPIQGDKDITVLLSVNSTGHFAHRLNKVLTACGHTRPNMVALSQAPSDTSSDVTVTALAMLNEGHRRQEIPCPICQASGSKSAVPVEPNSYLMRLSALSLKAIITRQISKPVRDVIERYSESGAFAIHRTHADGRHHAYYIDVLSMAGHPVFARRLDERVDELVSSIGAEPVAVLHPDLEPARYLAAMVIERIQAAGITVQVVVEANERAVITHPDLGKLGQASRVIIVDDVVITGRRLLAYRQQLISARRNAGLDGRVDLSAFVAVARPSSEGALQGTQDIVHHTLSAPRFFAIEQILLPNWSEDECNWCREASFLQGLPTQMRRHPIVSARIAALQQEDQESLLFSWPTADGDRPWRTPSTRDEWASALGGDAAGNDRSWELNPESIFGNVQGADLLMSVAASVQRLRLTRLDGVRVESRLDERFRSPISKTLDPELYLLGRFYEPIILAAIMRAARPHDLRPPEGDERLDLGLANQLQYLTTSEQMLGELLVQAALGNVPVIPQFFDIAFRSEAEQEIAGRFLRK